MVDAGAGRGVGGEENKSECTCQCYDKVHQLFHMTRLWLLFEVSCFLWNQESGRREGKKDGRMEVFSMFDIRANAGILHGKFPVSTCLPNKKERRCFCRWIRQPGLWLSLLLPLDP